MSYWLMPTDHEDLNKGMVDENRVFLSKWNAISKFQSLFLSQAKLTLALHSRTL